MSTGWRADKLQQLVELEGSDEMSMLESATFDSVAWGICREPDCDYTTQVEPDQDSGYCEVCGKTSVMSCLVLAGMI